MMSYLNPDEEAAREASEKRAEEESIPPELRTKLADLIEPHTMNLELEHAGVMTCLDVAYPVIREWLRGHLADL